MFRTAPNLNQYEPEDAGLRGTTRKYEASGSDASSEDSGDSGRPRRRKLRRRDASGRTAARTPVTAKPYGRTRHLVVQVVPDHVIDEPESSGSDMLDGDAQESPDGSQTATVKRRGAKLRRRVGVRERESSANDTETDESGGGWNSDDNSGEDSEGDGTSETDASDRSDESGESDEPGGPGGDSSCAEDEADGEETSEESSEEDDDWGSEYMPSD